MVLPGNPRALDFEPARREIEVLARVTSLTSPLDRIDDRVRLIQGELMPVASKLRGFEGGTWLVGRDSGRFMSVTYWTGEQDLVESEESVGRLRDLAQREVGGAIEWVRRFEIVASA
jgi:hypothetical protein